MTKKTKKVREVEILDDEIDGYDEADGIYDFASRSMLPFSVEVDHSDLRDDSPPGFYRWTRKGWTWTHAEPEAEAPDQFPAKLAEWEQEIASRA